MFWIQFLLVVAVLAVTVFGLRALRSDKALALKRILALLFVLAAVCAIIFPNLLSEVAHFFGIGRGTDFLLYGFIVVSMLFAVAVIRAKARSDARVTRLARAVALIEARDREMKNSGQANRQYVLSNPSALHTPQSERAHTEQTTPQHDL